MWNGGKKLKSHLKKKWILFWYLQMDLIIVLGFKKKK